MALYAHEQPRDCRSGDGIDHSIMDDYGVLALVSLLGQRGTFDDLKAWVHAINSHDDLLAALKALLRRYPANATISVIAALYGQSIADDIAAARAAVAKAEQSP